MLRKSLFLIFALLVSLPGTLYAENKKVADIIKAAEKEGQVVWMGALHGRETKPIIQAFSKEYPNIKVEYQRQIGGPAMERLMREIQVGTIPYDIIQIHSDYYTEFLKMDIIEQVNWKDFGELPELIHPDNRFVNAFISAFVFVFNTNLVKPEEAPKTWEDYLDPKWRGKFVVDIRPACYIRLTGAWGPEKVLSYLRKLRENEPIFRDGQTKTATLMAAGDLYMSSGMYLQSYSRVKAKGGPLGFNVPDPVPIDWYFYGVPKKDIKHPNAAKVFLGWLGSKGFKLIEKANWAYAAPFGGTRTEKLLKGKTLSFPPTLAQVPDRVKYTGEMLKALGIRK